MIAKSLKIRIIELLSSRPRTIQELRNILQIPERTLRYHLAILRRNGILKEIFLLSDRRVKLLAVSKKHKTNLTSQVESEKHIILTMFNMPLGDKNVRLC